MKASKCRAFTVSKIPPFLLVVSENCQQHVREMPLSFSDSYRFIINKQQVTGTYHSNHLANHSLLLRDHMPVGGSVSILFFPEQPCRAAFSSMLRSRVVFRCSSSTTNPVSVRSVDSSFLVFSLSSHRLNHQFWLYLSLSRFIINNITPILICKSSL